MRANGAYLGSLGADDDMTAVAAFPNLDLALLEHLRGLEIVEERAIPRLMLLFDGGYAAELLGQLGEALLLGGLRKPSYISVHS